MKVIIWSIVVTWIIPLIFRSLAIENSISMAIIKINRLTEKDIRDRVEWEWRYKSLIYHIEEESQSLIFKFWIPVKKFYSEQKYLQ